MKLSIVTTLYKSELHINEFYKRINAAANSLVKDEFEIIIVNDGSPDNSLDLAIKLTEADPKVKVIDLSRNFGHHKALMTGLCHASGERVFLVDSDLEEKPEWLVSFSNQMDEQQCDVVFGVQTKRRGGAVQRFTGNFFYKLFRLLTSVNQPDNIITARIMSRRYTQALIQHKEYEPNIGGLWIVTGFKQASQMVEKLSHSKTSYTFSNKVGHFVNAITSFSSLPLIFVFYSGCLILLSSLIYITYVIFRYSMTDNPIDGYTSLIASIWFFSGLLIFFLGIQGIYLAKVFNQVKQRPYTIVREIHQKTKQEEIK